MKDLLIHFTDKQDGNIAFHVGDVEANVLANHKKLAEKLGYDLNALVWMKQIHGNDVVVIDESYGFQNPPTCDAMVTNLENKPLMVMVADCTPILFYDKKQKAIAAVHAGRAGAFLNIIKKTVETMKENYQTDIKDLQVFMGASIKSCCYEVNQKIEEEANALGYGFAIEKRDGKIFLNVNKILIVQLQDLGIEDIEEDKRCTSCNFDSLYSYRKERAFQGRFAGIIMLR